MRTRELISIWISGQKVRIQYCIFLEQNAKSAEGAPDAVTKISMIQSTQDDNQIKISMGNKHNDIPLLLSVSCMICE